MPFDLTEEAVIKVPTRTILVANITLSNLLEGMLQPIPAMYFKNEADVHRWVVYAPIDEAEPHTKIWYHPGFSGENHMNLFPSTFFKGKRPDGQTIKDDDASKVVKYLVLTKFGKGKIAKLAGKNLEWVQAMCDLGVSVVKKPTPPKPKHKDGRWVQTRTTTQTIIEGPSFGSDDFDRVGQTFESKPTR